MRITMSQQPVKILCAVLLVWTGLWFLPAHGLSDTPSALKTITFSADQCKTAGEIAKALEKYHYTGKELDDAMSSQVLSLYIKRLDPTRQLFCRQDLTQFHVNENRVDDFILQGKLGFVEQIFNLYMQRNEERYQYILSLIDDWPGRFDFTNDESLTVDDEHTPWPGSPEELKPVWKKYIKNHILTFMLEGKEPNAITDELKKIYQSRLSRLYQTDIQDAFEIFINSAAAAFDPHSQYMPPRASEDFDIHMSLSLEGIGAVLQNEYEFTKVIRLIPAGPAEKSNQLKPGDRIVGVGQGLTGEIKDVLGQRIENVVRLIRGPKDTYVRLKIIPATDSTVQKTIHIMRDKVKLEDQSAKKKIITVSADGRPYRIGVITIPTFYLDFDAYNAGKKEYKSTTRDVETLLSELKEESIQGLIIDLRDNGGGALQEASLLTGLFLESGPTVQVKTKYRIHRLYDEDPAIYFTGPLMVMINRMSASASEIFAGAIKDYHRGIVVGTQSFGKGTVQSLQSLKRGKLKLTSAKFYRVSGDSTQARGVLPDIEYPHVYPVNEVGENSLDGTLPWDTIKKTTYRPYPDLSDAAAFLTGLYRKRSEKNPGIIYLTEKLALDSLVTEQKTVSLNRAAREKRKEQINQQQLDIENRYRSATGKPLLEKLSDLEGDDTTDRNEGDDGPEPDDILLEETQHLMAQFIRFSKDHGMTW